MKIALGQIRIVMGDKRANAASALTAVARASEAECDIVVLPECCLAGWLSPHAAECAEPISGAFTRRLAAAARQYRMAIVAGMEERGNDGRIYNTAVLIDRTGAITVRHRKINELEIARSTYACGASLEVSQLSGRPVAVTICADSWRPEITDALYLMGARIIFSPSAWAVEPGGEATNLSWIRETYRERVRDRDLFIVAPNGVGAVTEGAWKGRVLQGNSLVIGPGGEPLLCGPTNAPAHLCLHVPR